MNIPLFKIYTDEADVEAVAKVIRRGSHWANGPEIEQFEEMVAEYMGTKYAVAFNSGTSALHAALLALGVGRGDEVIVPSFTFPATANVVLAVGARPVFAEIEEATYGLDFDAIMNTACGVPRAVIPVHYAGCACRDIEKLRKWYLIEDAAESLGAVKLTGKVAMFSLCAPKVITTGEGGLLVTNGYILREALSQIRDHGNPDRTTLGYNWRMSSMTAALGMSQLGKIEEMIKQRRWNARYLSRELGQVQVSLEEQSKDVLRLPKEPAGSRHIYQMYTIRVPERHRDPLLAWLNHNGIGAKVYFPPVHLMPLYRSLRWKEGDLPITEQVAKEVITLPMYPDLTTEEIDYMVEMIRGYFEGERR